MDWTLLRVPAFRALWRGRALSWLGNGVAPIALAFAVLDLDGDVVDLGLVVAARSLPNLVLVLYGAAFADRLPKRAVAVVSSLLSALSLVGAAVLLLLGLETLAALALVAAVNGVAAALFAPASQAVVRSTLPEHRVHDASAVNRVAMHVGLVVGTAVGGFAVGAFGTASGLFVAAGAFAAAAVAFTGLPRGVGRTLGTAASWSGVTRELVTGTAFVLRNRWLISTALLAGTVQFAFGAGVHVLGPIAADAAFGGLAQPYGPIPTDETFGRTAWGFAGAVQTLGLVVGAVWATSLRGRLRLWAGCLAVAVTALPLVVLALVYGLRPLVIDPLHLAFFVCLALGAAGVALELFTVPLDGAVREQVPRAWLGRVYLVLTAASLGGVPLGELLAGPLVLLLGEAVTLTGLAALVALAATAVALDRRVRRIDAAPLGRR